MNRWFMYYLGSGGNAIGVKTAPVKMSGDEVKIPANAEWTDHGVILGEGPSGSWDKRFYGALSPCSLVKKDGTYFLYYIGADGDRSTDGGPRHRALGVATSNDGIHFTKRGRIITYLPHNNEEEGIFSAGAFLDDNGEIVMYYSALDAGSATSTTVDSDVRLAVSNDGLHFADKGDVISHANSSVWGYGDELFPVGAFREGNTYHVYYVAKGYGAAWDLGIASGSARNNIAGNTKGVLAPSPRIIGGCDPMRISPSRVALFICMDGGGQVRTASVTSPGALSSVLGTYSVTQDYPDTVYLDITLETFTETTVTCPVCNSTLKLTVSSVESNNITQFCPICGEPVGTGYSLAIITELPWPPLVEKEIKLITDRQITIYDRVIYNGWETPFNWNTLPKDSIQARYYTGWKPVIRTDGRYPEDTLSFPSLEACPYTFPPYASNSWSAYRSTLIYIKTGAEPLNIYEILEDEELIKDVWGIWWETGWIDMGRPIELPVTIPPNQRAIIQINHLIKGTIMFSLTPVVVYTCSYCGATFSSQAELDDHIAGVHPAPTYPCPYCSEIFSSQAELDDHIASEHPTEPPIAAVPEKPFYRRWAFWIPVGGITALIGGIAVWKKRKR